MKLNASLYRVNVPSIKNLLDDKDPKERFSYIGKLALSTNVPILVVAYYVGELYGFTDEINALISKLKLFYNVEGIIDSQEAHYESRR